VLFNQWKGLHTTSQTQTAVDAAGVGVSGLVRHVRLPELSASPHSATAKTGWGVSVDALVPIVPATAERHSNALSLTGSFVTGAGTADQYTGLSAGIAFPSPANPMMTSPAPAYNSTIDAGIVSFDSMNRVKLVEWQSFMVGLQYYTPIDNGKVWLTLNYSNLHSKNAADFSTMASAARIFDQTHYVDANICWDATTQLRFGVAYSWWEQQYVDNVKGHNNRLQFSGWFIF
jgi:hypothetical protein